MICDHLNVYPPLLDSEVEGWQVQRFPAEEEEECISIPMWLLQIKEESSGTSKASSNSEFIWFESQKKASSRQHVSTSCVSVARELLKPKQLWKNAVARLMMSPRIRENCQTCPTPVSKSADLYIVIDLRSGVLQQALDQPKPEPREPPWSYYICLIGCYSIVHMHLLPGNSYIWPLLCFFLRMQMV